eukprot:3754547-Lingulodinium_polyedra.AAC.1
MEWYALKYVYVGDSGYGGNDCNIDAEDGGGGDDIGLLLMMILTLMMMGTSEAKRRHANHYDTQ